MQRKRQRTEYTDWYRDNFDDEQDDDEEYSPDDQKENLDLFPLISEFLQVVKSQSTQVSQNTSPIPSEFWKRTECKVALTLIFQQLDLFSISNCSRVCKLWNQCISQPIFWNALYQKYFGRLSRIEVDWKEEFKHQFKNSKEVCMFGGNVSRSFVFQSTLTSNFVSPQLCQILLNASDDDEIDLSNVFLFHNKIFLLFSKSVQAYDLASSNCIWNTSISLEEAFDGLVADENTIYCKSRFGHMLAANINTGNILWKFTIPDFNDDVDQIRDLVLWNSELLYLDERGWLVARDILTGKELYEIKTPKNQPAKCTSNIVIHNSNIYWIVTTGENDFLYVAKDKQLVFHTDIGNIEEFEYRMAIDEEGTVFVIHSTDEDHFIKALKLDFSQQKIQVLWNFQFQKGFIDQLSSKSPFYYRGTVWAILCCEGSLIGLDAKTGNVIHTIKFAPSVDINTYITDFDQKALPLYSVDGVLYYSMYNNLEGATTYYLGAMDLPSGEQLWSTNFKSTYEADWRAEHQMALHPHVKMILGQAEKSLLLLWHH